MERKKYYFEWKKNIKNYDKIIIFDNGYIEAISKYIKSKNKKCKIILYLWNNMTHFNPDIIKDKYVDEIWTFNYKDSIKYALKYNPQFYSKNVNISSNIEENRVVFVGRDKGRSNSINKIKDELEKNNIQTDFYIINNEEQFISYDEYLKKVSLSNCLLDIVSDAENSGLSLRVLESIFFNKKLITNNLNVKKYDFFNEDNIYIINNEYIDMKKIKEFLEKPCRIIDKKVINKYEFNNWIRRFEL